MIHQDIIKWSSLAVKDPKYVGEWCASLMALHRLLWGGCSKVRIIFKKKKIPFNLYMQKKLSIIHDKIIKNHTYHERANGEVYIKTDRNKLKQYYKILDKAQKEIAQIEYLKSLDLPKSVDPIIDCTAGGM